MATKERVITQNHILDRNNDVFLTITIGNDQIGGSSVKFRNQSNVLAFGKIIGLKLGSGESLVGKVLEVRTRFFDRNEYTNNVSAIYNFNNGSKPFHVYFDHVENENDSFIFNASFTFK